MAEHGPLTAPELEQIGRLLLPMFQQGVREELHRLRNDMNSALLVQTSNLTKQFDDFKADVRNEFSELRVENADLKERVQELETFKIRAALVWAMGTFVVTTCVVSFVAWLFK